MRCDLHLPDLASSADQRSSERHFTLQLSCLHTYSFTCIQVPKCTQSFAILNTAHHVRVVSRKEDVPLWYRRDSSIAWHALPGSRFHKEFTAGKSMGLLWLCQHCTQPAGNREKRGKCRVKNTPFYQQRERMLQASAVTPDSKMTQPDIMCTNLCPNWILLKEVRIFKEENQDMEGLLWGFVHIIKHNKNTSVGFYFYPEFFTSY